MKASLKSTLCLLACLFVCNHLWCQMRQIHVEPDENDITRVSFYSSSEGYIGFENWIAFTSDSGRTCTKKVIAYYNVDFNGYTNVNLTFGFNVAGIKAFDRNNLLVYGHYGLVPAILYSSNGGDTFKLVFHSQFVLNRFATGITDMAFAGNSTLGFAVDADRVLKTIDRGLNWTVVRSDIDSYFNGVQAVDISNVFVWSTDRVSRKLLKSPDGGATWQSLNIPKGTITSCYFISSTKGWLSIFNTDDNTENLYTTINGGASWTQINHPEGSPFGSNKMVFVDDSLGYALTDLYTVSKTTDGGTVWEHIPRDNSFSYLGFTHNDLQVWSKDQLWAGGGHGLLEINTNAGGMTIPHAQFLIDTSGVNQSAIVHLVNYSKTGYQYQWYRNRAQISSDYICSYSHNVGDRNDTIALIVSNGNYSDTLTKIMYYNPPVVVSSFSPATGVYGTAVTITGTNFVDVQQVSFGGVAATFTVISSSQIKAYLGMGASGNVTVKLYGGESGSKDGFVYLPPPTVDLPFSIPDTTLCKSESVSVYIQNTEPGIRYELMNANYLFDSYGSVDSRGGTAVINTRPISKSGQFVIKATRVGYDSYRFFSTKLGIKVEHTRSSFIASKINVLPSEKVVFGATSFEASSFQWIFEGGANVSASNLATPEVFYATEGQKKLSLISTSANGCKDTLYATAVTVYDKQPAGETCYVTTMDSSSQGSTYLQNFVPDHHNGFIAISRAASSTKLNSRYGASAQLDTSGTCISEYTGDGVLRWLNYMKPDQGTLLNATTDDLGNIYLLGNIRSNTYFHYNATDSIRFYVQAYDTYPAERINGFILKLDSNRNYLWHSVFFDPTGPNTGYAYRNAYPTKIVVRGDDIILQCDFNCKLYYAHDGVTRQLMDFPSITAYSLQSGIVKLKADGNLSWFARIDNNYINGYSFDDLKIDEQRNVYLAGTYEYALNIYDAMGIQQASLQGGAAEFRSYIAKFDENGRFKWVNKISSTDMGRTHLSALATDTYGNCYVTGKVDHWSAGGQLRIETGSGANWFDNANGFMLIKFDAAGKRVWVAGTQYPYRGEGQSLLVRSDTVFVLGVIGGPETASVEKCFFPDNPQYPYTPAPGPYLMRYDTSGMLKRVVYGGYDPEYGDHFLASGMFVDENKNFLIGGNAAGTQPIFGLALPFRIRYLGSFLRLSTDFCLANIVPVADAGIDHTICSGDSALIGSPAVVGNSYHWVNKQGSFASTRSSLMVYPKVTTTYYLTVMNVAGFLATDSVVVNVEAAPIADAGIDQTICTGSAITLGKPAIGGNSYNWSSSPVGASADAGQITVSPATKTTYYLAVSSNGCTGRDTVVVDVRSSILPVVSISASNPAICSGSVISFTSKTQNGGDSPSYQWQVNGQNAGNNSNSFSTNIVSNSDQVKLLMTSSLSCASPVTVSSNIIYVNVLALPFVDAAPDAVVCAGSSSGVQIGPSPVTGTIYSWTPSLGLNSSSIAQPIANPQSTTTYYLEAAAFNGCKAKDTVTVTVQASPSPTITANGNVLSSSAALGNQWYLNGTAISGATAQTYSPVTSGLYMATTTIKGCTSVFSNSINYLVTGINDPQLDKDIVIAPNPVVDQLAIKYKDNSSTCSVVINDINGKVRLKNSFRSICRINMSAYSAGLYIVQIINERSGARIQKKIIKK